MFVTRSIRCSKAHAAAAPAAPTASAMLATSNRRRSALKSPRPSWIAKFAAARWSRPEWKWERNVDNNRLTMELQGNGKRYSARPESRAIYIALRYKLQVSFCMPVSIAGDDASRRSPPVAGQARLRDAGGVPLPPAALRCVQRCRRRGGRELRQRLVIGLAQRRAGSGATRH